MITDNFRQTAFPARLAVDGVDKPDRNYQSTEPDSMRDTSPGSETGALLDNILAFSGKLDPQGIVIGVSGKIFERTFEDPRLLAGHGFSETVFWHSSEANYSLVKDAIDASCRGMFSRTTAEFRISADETAFVELTLQPAFKDNGTGRSVKHIVVCGQDVTVREKELRFYKQRADHLLYAAENAGIGLWFWDLKEGTVFSTPQCNELFEISPFEQIDYESLIGVLHPEDRENVVKQILAAQQAGGEYESEYRVIYRNGSVHWLSTSGTTYLDADGLPASMMGVVRKITDRKNDEAELARVCDSERKARDEAEEANRTNDHFLAVVSHELRSPLNAIIGWTRILLTKDIDEETTRNALQTIERSAISQAKLIGDLVDSSRTASGRLRLELRPSNLLNVIKTVYNSHKPAAEARKIGLDLNYDCENFMVFGDAVRLQQVFANLVSNALKFSPEGGYVRIDLKTSVDSVSVSVTDNGQGIGKESLPRIFLQFSQRDELHSRDRSGLGLGLSIVKALVEQHRGTVRAESKGLGQGATFIVKFTGARG